MTYVQWSGGPKAPPGLTVTGGVVTVTFDEPFAGALAGTYHAVLDADFGEVRAPDGGVFVTPGVAVNGQGKVPMPPPVATIREVVKLSDGTVRGPNVFTRPIVASSAGVYAYETPVWRDGPNVVVQLGESGGGLDPEQVRAVVAAFVKAGANVQVVHDDAANTLTISSTGGGGGGSNVPDPSGVPNGKVIVTLGGAYALTDLPSGGGGSLTVKNTTGTFDTVAASLVFKNFSLTTLGSGAVEVALDQATARNYGPSNPVPLEDVPAVFAQHGAGPGQCPNYSPNESNGFAPYAYFDVLGAASADSFGLLVFEQNSAEYVHTLTLTRIRRANGSVATDEIFEHVTEPFSPGVSGQRWVSYTLPVAHDFLIGERYVLTLSTDTPFQNLPIDPASAASLTFGPFRKLNNVDISGISAAFPIRIGTSAIEQGVYGALPLANVARGAEIEALLDSTVQLTFDENGPARVGPLALWLRASDLDALANGASVAAWPDATGKTSGLVQASGGAQPTLQKGVANGRSALRFAGLQWMSLAALPTYASPALTVVVVLANVGTNSAVVLETSANANINTGSFAMYVEPVRYVVACANINSGGAVNLAQSTATLAGNAVGYALETLDYTLGTEAASVAVNTSSAQTRVLSASNTALTFADRPFYLGGRGGSGGFIGDVLEVLIFLGRLSPAAHADLVHTYLKPRYGLVF